MKRLSTISMKEPKKVAPKYPGSPKADPTAIPGPTNVKSVPMTMGNLFPTGPIPTAWMTVARPATKSVVLTMKVLSSRERPRALLTTSGTATIPAKAARICWSARAIDRKKVGLSLTRYLISGLPPVFLGFGTSIFASPMMGPPFLVQKRRFKEGPGARERDRPLRLGPRAQGPESRKNSPGYLTLFSASPPPIQGSSPLSQASMYSPTVMSFVKMLRSFRPYSCISCVLECTASVRVITR